MGIPTYRSTDKCSVNLTKWSWVHGSFVPNQIDRGLDTSKKESLLLFFRKYYWTFQYGYINNRKVTKGIVNLWNRHFCCFLSSSYVKRKLMTRLLCLTSFYMSKPDGGHRRYTYVISLVDVRTNFCLLSYPVTTHKVQRLWPVNWKEKLVKVINFTFVIKSVALKLVFTLLCILHKTHGTLLKYLNTQMIYETISSFNTSTGP